MEKVWFANYFLFPFPLLSHQTSQRVNLCNLSFTFVFVGLSFVISSLVYI